MNNDTIVKFDRVQKSYDGELLVVKDLNLEIKRGEFLTLLGPAGSGKTTTLLMLAGFETMTRGTIELAGQSLRNVPPHKRDIGMVFQNYALFPHMTVYENLAFSLRARKLPRSDEAGRIDRALDMVQLGGFERRRPGQLSGGQQQRVAVARALVYEPRLVLMDEPLGALDKQLREQMQIELRRIHEHVGVTFVYVTHDQSEALTMSDRIVVFNDGEVEQIATPEELYEQPLNSFVAQFIGENNQLQGEVTVMNGENCTVKIEGGDSVQALAVKVDGVGTRTTLSIRPESVMFDPPADSVPNRFDCRVKELIYLGDHTRVRVDVCGNDDFIIKVARSESAPQIQIGQTLPIGWMSHDCRALDPG